MPRATSDGDAVQLDELLRTLDVEVSTLEIQLASEHRP